MNLLKHLWFVFDVREPSGGSDDDFSDYIAIADNPFEYLGFSELVGIYQKKYFANKLANKLANKRSIPIIISKRGSNDRTTTT